MDISLEELVQEIQKQFPKELTIALQAVQIRKLQQGTQAQGEEPSSEEVDTQL